MNTPGKRIRAAGSAVGVVALLLVSSATAFALGPHEILLLVNSDASNSVRVAEEYMRLRDIPPANRVDLRLNDALAPGTSEIAPTQFKALIYDRALAVATERGIAPHLLAWVYSTDFPFRVKTSPPVSITGMTFVRGRALSSEEIAKAKYKSPLFGGPETAGKPAYASQTLDVAAEWLEEQMPLPAMMLGYTGKNGNSVEAVLACLRRGKASDFTRPEGTVYFQTGEDVRTKCRQWQFPSAAAQLQRLGIQAVVGEALPTEDSAVLGIMAGRRTIALSDGVNFLPGAMAEHLTSFGGAFDTSGQTKLSMWIAAGATASSGTVTEPYSAWLKFPNAWFYVHYASGCTMLESFCLAIRSPLQILLVGDPLACPWAEPATLKVRGVPEGAATGVLTFTCTVERQSGAPFTEYTLLLDDRVVDRRHREPLVLDTRRFSPGDHRLRFVATRAGTVRGQVYVNRTLTIAGTATDPQAPDGMDDGAYQELKGLLNPE